jgi:predicted translin family RNA/ssDNA-binding protein
MLDKKDLKEVLEDYNLSDQQRELLIKKSRDVLKLSKQLIYSIHREDLESAKELSKQLDKSFGELRKIAENNPELKYSGSSRISAQEYAEAMCYFYFVSENRLPTRAELKLDADTYLLGLCDLTGELVRKAINDAIKGRLDSALKIKEVVEEIYGELLQFDFRNSELRKKFDSIKYDLRRLEDLALNIKLKAK